MNRLRALLGPKPNHPWAALIPQVLVWSFRRFCVEKLLLLDSTSALLSEQVWEDFFELIRNYAPKGMEAIAGTWLKPEHIAEMYSSLEDYNTFFLECLDLIDEAVSTENETLQAAVSEFLDEEMKVIFQSWLTGPEQVFFIFPTSERAENEFTDAQYMSLIHALLNYSKLQKQASLSSPPPVQVVFVAEPVAAPTVEPAVEPAAPSVPAEPPPVPAEAPAVEPAAPSVPAEPPPASLPAPPEPSQPRHTPVATALAKRRHTFRRYGHRANRGTTLRSYRRRNTTRRAAGSIFPVSNTDV